MLARRTAIRGFSTLALSNFSILPGVYKDDSSLASEGRVIDSNNVRPTKVGSIENEWEVIGGWESLTTEAWTGICRGAHAWADISGTVVLGFGTATSLYAYYGGEIKDVTPLKAKTSLENAFATTNGSPTVIVSYPNHGLLQGDAVTFSHALAVGGITINGAYTVATVMSRDKFTITHSSNATSTATGGGGVDIEATLDAGLVDGLGGFGFGTGVYGSGTYGTTVIGASYLASVWHIDNWGNNMLALRSNGPLYEWQPVPNYGDVVINGGFDTADGWTAGTGWTIAAGVATAVAGSATDLSIDMTGLISGGVTYEVSFDATVTAGEFVFRVYSEDLSADVQYGKPIEASGTYTRRFQAPASPTLVKFAKDAAFAGTVDNVSISVVEVAYRLQDAPSRSLCMFVDPNRFVVCCGTVQYNGDFNALCVRWSDQENNTDWIPSNSSLSGEYTLARGSRIMGGLASSSTNLIWTDDALYTMRYTTTSDVFQFQLVGTGCGLMGSKAAAEYQGAAFWAGNNRNFYIYEGGSPRVLNCTVRKEFFDNLAPGQEEKICCGINPAFGEVWWFYPDSRDGDENSRYVVYSWFTDSWYLGTMDRTAWVRPGVYTSPISFSTDSGVYLQEQGKTANGDALSWHLETSYFDIGDGAQRMNVKRFVPDFKGQSGAITLTMKFKQFANDTEYTAGPYTITRTTTKVDFRHTGRLMSARIEGSQSPAYMRTGAFRLDVEPSGARR